jgi:hypothetical protein
MSKHAKDKEGTPAVGEPASKKAKSEETEASESAPPTSVSGLFDHISIPVSDMEKSKSFYVDSLKPLGVKVIMDFGKFGCGMGAVRVQSVIHGPETGLMSPFGPFPDRSRVLDSTAKQGQESRAVGRAAFGV